MRTALVWLICLVLFITGLLSQAADLYWDGGTIDIGGNGNGVSAGGSGTWNTTIKNWDQNGVPFIAWPVPQNSNRAFLGGLGGTVTFGVDLGPGASSSYPNSVFVTTGNYVFDLGTNGLSFRGSGLVISNTATLVLTNGTVTLLSAGITVTGPNALKIYSKVSGSVTVSKAGGGDVFLYNDANDFSGRLAGANGLGISFTSIKNGGVASAAGTGTILENSANNVMTYIGPGDSSDRTFLVSGGGNDTFNSSGSGALIWTGPFQNTKGDVSTLIFGGSNTSSNEFRGNLTNSTAGALSLTKADAGTWILSGTNTYSGTTTITGGKLIIGGAGSLGSGSYASAIPISSGALFEFGSTSNQTLSGVISGSGSLIKTNTSTLTLSGTNTYTGATLIRGGTLKAGSTNGLSSGSAFTVAGGGILDLGGFNNTISILSTTSTVGIITDSSAPGSGGMLRITNALSGTLNSNVFTGSLGLQLYGGNTVNTLLSVTTNTYSGGTILGNGSGTVTTRWLGSGTIGGGTPGALTNGLFGTGPITIGAATTDRVQFYVTGTTLINNNIVVNSALGDTAQLGAFRLESGPLTIAGSLNANLADVMFSANNGTASRTGTVTGVIFGNSGLRVLAQASALISVVLNNTGTANSYAGNTSIDSANATLVLGAANQIPNGTSKGNLVISNGTFSLGGFSDTINGLSGTGTVDGISGTPTLTVGDNNATSTFAGVIKNSAGTLSLAKIGTGTLTLTGTNTYSGATTISTGTFTVGGSGSLGSGNYAGAITNNSTFNYSSTSTQTLSGGINGVGSLSQNAASVLTLSGTNTYSGTTTISAGTVVLTDGLSTNMNQVVTVGAGGSLILTNGARLFTTNGMNQIATSSTIAMYSNTVWNMRGLNTNPGNGIGGTSNRFLVADGAIVTNTFGVGNSFAVNGNYCTLEIVNGGKVYWQNGGVLFGQFVTRNNRILIGGSGAPAYMQNLGGMQIPQSGGTIANYGVIVSNGVWDVGAVYLGRSASTGNYIQVFAGGVVNFNGNILSIADSGAGISNYMDVIGGLVTNVSQILVPNNNSISVNGGTIAAGANGTLLTGAGKAYIRAGGATIDTVAFTTTIAMGLKEDPLSTGGGLTKLGSGALTLFAVNTYTGDTAINAGTLALVAPGSISSSPRISVAAGATFNTGTDFSLGAGQTLAGEGTVVSTVTVNGAVSPGIAGIGTLTSSNVTWNAGVAWPFELGASSSSDRLRINGSFTKGTGSGFAFDLQNTGSAGVYTLVTWSASTTFVAGDFTANNVPSGFAPTFAVNANELILTLDNAPTVGPVTLTRISGQPLHVLVSNLMTNSFNTAGGSLTCVWVSATSSNGHPVSLSGNWVLYNPPSSFNATDQFNFRLANTNGVEAESTVTVLVIPPVTNSFPISNAVVTNGGLEFRWAGIPGRTNLVEGGTELGPTPPANWSNLETVVIGALGYATFFETNPPSPRYYRILEKLP